jgi:hypothetical protein
LKEVGVVMFVAVTQQFHAVIDGSVRAIVGYAGGEWWQRAGTIASAVVAAFTGWLAWSTRRLAVETAGLAKDQVAASLLSDRHHQESVSPILVFDGTVELISDHTPDGTCEHSWFRLRGDIKNVGNGPAFDVQVTVTPAGHEAHRWVITFIDAKSEVVSLEDWDIVNTYPKTGTYVVGRQATGAHSFNVDMTGLNLFGTRGHTEQGSVSGASADLRILRMRPAEFLIRT